MIPRPNSTPDLTQKSVCQYGSSRLAPMFLRAVAALPIVQEPA
jgi:hypothetical protein